MSEKIVQLNEEVIKSQIKELVCGSVEETLNELLEKEAESLTQAARYERSEARQGYRSGHYDRSLTSFFQESFLRTLLDTVHFGHILIILSRLLIMSLYQFGMPYRCILDF